MTAPETDADREFLRRVLDTATKHFHDAGACFVKAKGYIREAGTCLAKGDYEGAQDFYEMASEKALRAIGLMTHMHIPGCDPAQLAARDNPKIVRGRAWLRDKDLTTLILSPRAEFLAKQQEMAKGRDELSEQGLLFGSEAKLSTKDILGAMAAKGMDNDAIAAWYVGLMESTENKGTINQKVEVGRLVARVIQHTEPRQLFEINDMDIEGLTDDELEEITREAATVVGARIEQAKRGK